MCLKEIRAISVSVEYRADKMSIAGRFPSLKAESNYTIHFSRHISNLLLEDSGAQIHFVRSNLYVCMGGKSISRKLIFVSSRKCDILFL